MVKTCPLKSNAGGLWYKKCSVKYERGRGGYGTRMSVKSNDGGRGGYGTRMSVKSNDGGGGVWYKNVSEK